MNFPLNLLTFGVLSGVHPHLESADFSRAIATIRATSVEDRDIKLLVADELLSLFGLLEDGPRIGLPESVALQRNIPE